MELQPHGSSAVGSALLGTDRGGGGSGSRCPPDLRCGLSLGSLRSFLLTAIHSPSLSCCPHLAGPGALRCGEVTSSLSLDLGL